MNKKQAMDGATQKSTPKVAMSAGDTPDKTTDGAKEKHRKRWPGAVFAVGLAVLVAGAAFLLTKILAKPAVRDAEYLVQVGAWAREDAPAVVWDFTEIGKGTLTTDAYNHDYAFIWALDGDRLTIETEWLYTLNDEYTYTLDQEHNLLILSNGDDEWAFAPTEDDTAGHTDP